MTGNAVQRHGNAVQVEAGVAVHVEGAVAVGDRHGIQHRAVLLDGSGQSVQIGVLHTVPAVGLIHIDQHMGMFHGSGLSGANGIAFSIGEDHLQCRALGANGEQVHAGLAGDVGGHEYAGGTHLQQVEVSRLHFDEVHITVQTAVEGEVGILRIDIRRSVGNGNGQDVAAVLHGRSQVEAEGGESALVGAQFTAVAVDGGHMVGALELDVLLLALGGIGELQLVGSDAAPVISAAILAVQSVPGVGEGNGTKGLTVLGEQSLGQESNIAHDRSTPFHIEHMSSHN